MADGDELNFPSKLHGAVRVRVAAERVDPLPAFVFNPAQELIARLALALVLIPLGQARLLGGALRLHAVEKDREGLRRHWRVFTSHTGRVLLNGINYQAEC